MKYGTFLVVRASSYLFRVHISRSQEQCSSKFSQFSVLQITNTWAGIPSTQNKSIMLPKSSMSSHKQWPPYDSTITFCVHSFHPNRRVYSPPPPISRAPLHLENLSLMDGFLSKGGNSMTTIGLSSRVHTEGKLFSSSFARSMAKWVIGCSLLWVLHQAYTFAR